MKTLTAAEVAALQLKSSQLGKGQTDRFYREASRQNVGEALFITKSEWPAKSPPCGSNMPKRYRSRGEQYRVHTLADNSGWIIIRTN